MSTERKYQVVFDFETDPTQVSLTATAMRAIFDYHGQRLWAVKEPTPIILPPDLVDSYLALTQGGNK